MESLTYKTTLLEDTGWFTLLSVILVISGHSTYAADKSDCFGMFCENGGTVEVINDECRCICPHVFSGLYCEYELRQSMWPVGPYAVPMTKYGCPEAQSHGWRISYINISYVVTLGLFLETHNMKDVSVTDDNDIPKLNGSLITDSLEQMELLGPFGQYSIQLNFCLKEKGHSLHTRSGENGWPEGNYSIYGTEHGCPEGFKEENYSKELPPILHWNSDGYLPYVNLETHDNVTGSKLDDFTSTKFKCYGTLKLVFCRRVSHSTINLSTAWDFPFILLQERSSLCPRTSSKFDVKSEEVYISATGHYLLDHRFCFFNSTSSTTKEIEDTAKIKDNCSRINVAGLLYIYESSYARMKKVIARITDPGLDNADVIAWMDGGITPYITIDMRSSTKVSMLELNYDRSRPFLIDHLRFFMYPDTHVAVPLLVHSVHYVNGYSVVKFARSVQGRYFKVTCNLAADVKKLYKFFLRPFFVSNIYTCGDINSERTCRNQLGMADGGIEDFQVTSSSWQPQYPPSTGRPFYGGWCASHEDRNPYFQIDLLTPTLVEAIIISKWSEILEEFVDYQFRFKIIRYGVTSFKIEYGIKETSLQTYNEKEFIVNLARAYAEPQAFHLNSPFVARYVRVYLNSLVSFEGGICMKLELLGCRKTGVPSLKCVDDSTKHFIKQENLVKPFDGALQLASTTDTTACEGLCAITENCGYYEYNVDMSCALYNMSLRLHYQPVTQLATKTNNASLAICSKVFETTDHEYSETVYVHATGGEVITNYGYPLHYDTDYKMTWIVTVQEDRFITLIFTNVSLHVYEGDTTRDIKNVRSIDFAFDNIRIGDFLIDNQLNGYRPILRTMLAKVRIQLTSFSMESPRIYRGFGFRAIVHIEDVPTCYVPKEVYFSDIPSRRLEFTCDNPTMRLSSMSFNGIPNTVEWKQQWTITRGGFNRTWIKYNVALTFTDFNIHCSTGTKLIIRDVRRVDWEDVDTYCNLNRPPHIYYSRYEKLQIEYAQPKTTLQINGMDFFEAFYHFKEDKIDIINLYRADRYMYMWWTQSPHQQKYYYVRSDILGKDYYILPASVSWTTAKDVCLSMGYTLVNIHSRREMTFLKSWIIYFVKTSKRKMLYDLNEDNMYFYIGLFRSKMNGKLSGQWEDRTAVTFTAWKTGEVIEAVRIKCTGMEFLELNVKDTWITVDCASSNAHYLICENKTRTTHRDNHVDAMDLDLSTDVTTNVNPTLYHCKSGEMLQESSVCNGVPECLDQSDEQGCAPMTFSTEDVGCTADEFKCNNDRCIALHRVCDFIPDCPLAEDEYCDFATCNETLEFGCDTGQCIPIENRCDAIQHCTDGSDEITCNNCVDTAYLCTWTRVCVPMTLRCDGYHDCGDMEDEHNCQPTFESCADRWNAGYQSNSSTTLNSESGDFNVFCHYSVTDKTVYIRTIISERDLLIHYPRPDAAVTGALNYLTIMITLKDNVLPTLEKTELHEDCIITIQQSCWSHTLQVANYDDLYLNGSHKQCLCADWTYTFLVEQNNLISLEITNCFDGSRRLANEYPHQIQKGGKPGIFFIKTLQLNDSDIRINPGPIICSTDTTYSYETITCVEGYKVISKDKQCLYDHDEYGYSDGCRSGLHLQHCADFVCPFQYAKCPNSFCIAARFVCDGERTCPGGEDEDNCWCMTRKDSINIAFLYHDSSDYLNITIENFARQLQNGIIDAQRTNIFSFRIISETRAIHKFKFFPYNERFDTMAKTLDSLPFKNNTIKHIVDFFDDHLKLFIIYIKGVEINEELIDLTTEARNRVTSIQDIHIYRISEDSNLNNRVITKKIKANEMQIQISDWELLSSIGPMLLTKICPGVGGPICMGGYRCKLTRVCIPLSQICDGQKQCLYDDDEQFCDFYCPSLCKCAAYTVDCSSTNFSNADLNDISSLTKSLDLSNNMVLSEVGFVDRNELRYLIKLNVSKCAFKEIPRQFLMTIKNLISLDMSFNQISNLGENTFQDLKFLTELVFKGNHLRSIESLALSGLTSVRHLAISGTNLQKVPENAFYKLNLTTLDLSGNKIKEIEDFAFRDVDVNYINLENNDINTFGVDIFTGIRSLNLLKTPAFKFCCLRPRYLPEDDCTPRKDEFSSCEDLMRNSALQTFMWLIGLLALLGNILSLIYRLLFDRDRLKLGFGVFVTNLALADMLMGVYLIIIAIADLWFRKRYILNDGYWRNSPWCTLAGVLSTVSSESSVLFLCLITLDRILVIKYPFGQIRFGTKSASFASAICWFIALVIALVPLTDGKYFDQFYSKSGVCVALPLTRHPTSGWLYSVLIFIGFNFVTFLLIGFGQLLIFLEVQKSSSKLKNKQTSRRRDLKITRNLLMVVATDFLCWFPVGVMGLMALNGHVISGDMYAWTAVLILPINSALNPFLYTLSAIVSQKFVPNVKEQAWIESSNGMGAEGNMMKLWHSHQFIRKQEVTTHLSLSLEDFLRRRNSIPVMETARLAIQLASSLHFLHQNNLIHGQLTGNNVLVNPPFDNMDLRHTKIMLKLQSCCKQNEKAEDMYDLGCLLRKMIMKN